MENKKSIEEINYEIKLFELEKVKKEAQKTSFNLTAYLTLIVALISLLGTFIANYIQKNNQLELDRQKFESELIITAVKANDLKTSRDNLKFLLDIGLIKMNSIQLKEVLSDSSIPILQFKPYKNINPIYSLEGQILLPKGIDLKKIEVSIFPHSAQKNTESLKQKISITEKGKFKIESLEEIGYAIEFKYNSKIIKRILHMPDKKIPNEIKVYNLSDHF